MIRQRSGGLSLVVQASAEALPFRSTTFDAALATLTLHHWTDWRGGLFEMRRVAGRLVIFTFEPRELEHFWLIESYFPEMSGLVRAQEPPVDDIVACLGDCRIDRVAISHDCADGFLAAFWCRPAAYLDSGVRAAMSGFALLDPKAVDRGVSRLPGRDARLTGRSNENLHRRHALVSDRRPVSPLPTITTSAAMSRQSADDGGSEGECRSVDPDGAAESRPPHSGTYSRSLLRDLEPEAESCCDFDADDPDVDEPEADMPLVEPPRPDCPDCPDWLDDVSCCTRRWFCTSRTPGDCSAISSAARFSSRELTVPLNVTSPFFTSIEISLASMSSSSISRSDSCSFTRSSDR